VTFKDLQKLVQSQSEPEHRLRNKPFWIWNQNQHKQGNIKSMEIVVLITLWIVKKIGIEKPIFNL
jgi:hypothetical protein